MIKDLIQYKDTTNFNLTDVYLVEAKTEENYVEYIREYPFTDFREDGSISFSGEIPLVNFIGEGTNFFIENREYLLENYNGKISKKSNEIVIYENLDSIKNIFNKKPINIDFGNKRYFIEGYEDNENYYVLKLDGEIEETNINVVDIYVVDYVSDFLQYQVISSNTQSENGESNNFLVLSGHNTENLSNYDGHTKNDSEITIYEDLDAKFDNLSYADFEKIEPQNLKIDFSNFSNHVKFGSANAKVVNAEKKFISYRSKTEKSDIKNIIDSFSPFEKWIFENKYTSMTEANFNTYIDNLKVVAQDYDAQNAEFIWYSVPSAILEEDTTGYFSNFLLLIGEVFDYFYTHINAMGLLKDNPHLEEAMGDMFVFEELKDLGFSEEYAYNISTFQNFYEDTNAVKEVSYEIARRLLHNLPLLNSSKGTLKIVDYIFNIYGIPKNLFEVIEFTNNKRDDNISELKYNENRYYLNIPNSSSSVDIDFASTDLTTDYTIELAINNFEGSGGKILEFGGNSISFTNSSSYYGIDMITDSTSSVQTGNVIPDNNFWTYVGISKSGSNGHIYISQQDDTGYGLVNTKEFDFTYIKPVSTFSSMTLYPTNKASIAEFKIFNRGLTEKEFRDHAKDLKSIAEIKGKNSINLYKSFSKPETGSVTSDIGGYNITYNNISLSDFAIDEFFSFTDIKLFDQEYGGNKITLGEITYDGNRADLSSIQYNTDHKNVNKNNDPNRLGIFISPTQKINKQIFRKIIDDADLIPVPYKDPNSYEFVDLNNEIMELTDIDPKYSDMYYYYYLQSLLSDKLFRLIKHFMPANTDLEMGLLIQNNVLRKNKYPNGEKFMTTRTGLTEKVKSDVKEESINKLGNSKTVMGSSTSSQLITKLEPMITIREKNRYSVYLNTVETNVITTSPFATNVYKSSNLNAVANAFENLEDAGASIQIN